MGAEDFISERFLAAIHSGVKYRAFFRWSDAVREVKQMRVRVARVLNRMLGRTLANAFYDWNQWVVGGAVEGLAGAVREVRPRASQPHDVRRLCAVEGGGGGARHAAPQACQVPWALPSPRSLVRFRAEG